MKLVSRLFARENALDCGAAWAGIPLLSCKIQFILRAKEKAVAPLRSSEALVIAFANNCPGRQKGLAERLGALPRLLEALARPCRARRHQRGICMREPISKLSAL